MFGDGVDPAVLYRVVHEPPSVGELIEELRELVEACLRKDPAHRPNLNAVIQACQKHSRATSLKLSGDWLPPAYIADIHRRMAGMSAFMTAIDDFRE